MQVKIKRETLLKGVGRTLGVVDRRGTMPILANFLLQTGGQPGPHFRHRPGSELPGFLSGGGAGTRGTHRPGALLL